MRRIQTDAEIQLLTEYANAYRSMSIRTNRALFGTFVLTLVGGVAGFSAFFAVNNYNQGVGSALLNVADKCIFVSVFYLISALALFQGRSSIDKAFSQKLGRPITTLFDQNPGTNPVMDAALSEEGQPLLTSPVESAALGV